MAQKVQGLVYSVKDDGAFCKYCVLFAANHDTRITDFGVLVNQPLTHWQKAPSKLNDHFGNTKYHALSLEIASNFMILYLVTLHLFLISWSLPGPKKSKKTRKNFALLLIALLHVQSKAFHFEAIVMIDEMLLRMLILIMATY